ncbi:MAG: hypothetical protein Q8S14_15920 [Algoriphagus sp.]|jgi:hypothetical protein|uniref:DUF6992 family protein n=1 Tax=Algoriphagus sp. TaxID=1872435 RepID=UPI00272F33F6|nr:hypothetical protein [Algoriphagus sp.]MDP2041608.1 hypothetical protein [Algoriphagus sp.]MDP3473355.1 hypothetical protein [Algoriphagus sp.]
MKKSPLIISLLVVFILLLTSEAFAQEIPALSDFNRTRLDYNQKGMIILGSWAVGNMVWGGIGASQTIGQNKAFHQMNLYWNSVNLMIAGFGYWQATKEVPGTDFWATMEGQQGIEKVLLLNGALDVAYMAGGFFMKERGLRKGNDRLIGFGKSVILQGAFLLAFDGVMYRFHHVHGKELPNLVQNISLGPTGVYFRMNF